MTYYKSNFYPVDGAPDDPVPVWDEFNRIRDHLSSLDQNNVAKDGVSPGRIVLPGDPKHHGISDVRTDDTGYMDVALIQEKFPYMEADGESLHPGDSFQSLLTMTPGESGVWHRINGNPYLASHLSRGNAKLDLFSRWEAPWVFGASVEFAHSNPVNQSTPFVSMRINTSKTSPPADMAVGRLNYPARGFEGGRTGLCSMASMIVPPGKFEAYVTARTTWRTEVQFHPEDVGDAGAVGVDLTWETPPGPNEQVSVTRVNLFAFGLYR